MLLFGLFNRTDNTNSETGIRFGVIYANRVPWLHEEIVTNGDSITYRNFQQALADRVRYALTEEDGDLKDVLDDYYMRDHAQEEILQYVNEYQGDWSEQEIEEVSEQIIEELNNSGVTCFDEEEYEYEKDDEQYLLSFQGGAPTIWVIKSPVMTKTRLCSPCVPNAGDLSSPDPEDGYECYAVPIEWFDEGECPYTTFTYAEIVPELILE